MTLSLEQSCWHFNAVKTLRGKLWCCRNPPSPSHPFTGRFVWAVPYSLLLRNKVEDIQAACELTQQSTNTVERMLSEFDREAATLRRDVQRELKYAEVEGPGLLWGSNPMAQPPPPRLAVFTPEQPIMPQLL